MKFPDWSHTIVCGNLNYNLILEIQYSICENLKIIKLDIDNLTPSNTVNYYILKSFE